MVFDGNGFGRCDVVGNITVATMTFSGYTSTFTSQGYDVTISSYFSQSSGAIVLSTSNIFVQGDFLRTGGTYYADASILQFNGGKNQSLLPGGTSFFNLTINKTGGTVNLASDLDVNSLFSHAASGTFNQSTSTMYIGGDFNIAATATFTKASGNEFIIFDGTGTFTDSHAAGSKQDLGQVILDGGIGTTVTIGNDVKLSSLTINTNNVFNLNGSTFAFLIPSAVLNSGTFRLQGGETLTNVTNLGTGFSSTVEYVGDNDGSADTYTLKEFGATDFGVLLINGTDANDVFRATNPVADQYTFVRAATLDANQYPITSSFITFIEGGNYLAKGATQTLSSFAMTGGQFTGSTGPVTMSGFNMAGGTFTASSASTTVSVAGTFSITAATAVFNHNNGTFRFASNSDVFLVATSSVVFYNLFLDQLAVDPITIMDNEDVVVLSTLTVVRGILTGSSATVRAKFSEWKRVS
jgi:hypothetical protein